MMVRNASSYGALGAVTTMAAFMIYCAVSKASSYPSSLPYQPVRWIDRSDF